MHYKDLNSFLATGQKALKSGPIAIVVVEDNVEVESTLRHNVQLGFKSIIALIPDHFTLPQDLNESVHRIHYDICTEQSVRDTINQLIAAAPQIWMYYCYNAEYLLFPFCETRKIGEMLSFHSEERRDAMLCYVIDLYSNDLREHPNGVSLMHAHLDQTGYYALGRKDPQNHNHPKERQLDFYGGLRWRFEEHIPHAKRRIDRIAVFKAQKGLKLCEGHIFNDEEYNTYACPWHHNLTAAICSFRVAKALKSNPTSALEIDRFDYHNSRPFEWHSRQLMDLGLMEPGQWF